MIEMDEIDGRPLWAFAESQVIVPGYLAWERLGIGVRCETWLAWSVEAWSPVVVKLARPEQVSHPRGIAAVGREADVLAAVRHAALPRLIADGRGSPVPHFVTQYVDGPSLADMLDDNGAWGVRDACMLIAQVLAALRALHGAGYAHLDLKPDNVLIQGGRAVVVDLGSSRSLGDPQPSGQPIGTAGYAALELESGADIAAPMDVFGAGIVLAETLLGVPVFDTDLPAARRPTAQLDAAIPAALRDLVLAMLDPEPSARPTIAAVLHALPDIMGDDAEDLLWPAWVTRTLEAANPRLAATA